MIPAQSSFTTRQKNMNGVVRGIPSLPFRPRCVSRQMCAKVLKSSCKHSSIFGTGAQNLLVLSGSQSRRVNGVMKVQAFMGGNSVDPVRIAVQIASIVIAGVIAWVVNQQTQLEQDTTNMDAQACPRCNGTGYEPCWCQGWSDGDVGCSSCSRTGYMACRSCGGGGIATPLPVKVNMDRR